MSNVVESHCDEAAVRRAAQPERLVACEARIDSADQRELPVIESQEAIETRCDQATIQREVELQQLVAIRGVARHELAVGEPINLQAALAHHPGRELRAIGREAQCCNNLWQSPDARGQCTGLSIEQVDARTALGIPARPAANGERAVIGRERKRVKLAVRARADRNPERIQQAPIRHAPDTHRLVFGRRVEPAGAFIERERVDEGRVASGVDAQDGRRRQRVGRARVAGAEHQRQHHQLDAIRHFMG